MQNQQRLFDSTPYTFLYIVLGKMNSLLNVYRVRRAYHLRGSESELILPLPKADNLKKIFKHSGAVLCLPETVRVTTSMRSFTQILHCCIIPTR